MKWLFLTLIVLIFSGCEGSRRVGGTYQHGNVPITNFNKSDTEAVTTISPPIEQVSNPSTLSFWTVYLPFLIIVLYITYKTFSNNGNPKN